MEKLAGVTKNGKLDVWKEKGVAAKKSVRKTSLCMMRRTSNASKCETHSTGES